MGALRERDLGWSRDALIESLHAAATTGDADRLRHEYAWMARIANVATDGLVTDAEQAAPTPAVIARLRHAARDFDQSRDANLRQITGLTRCPGKRDSLGVPTQGWIPFPKQQEHDPLHATDGNAGL